MKPILLRKQMHLFSTGSLGGSVNDILDSAGQQSTATNNGGSHSNPSSKPGTPKPPEMMMMMGGAGGGGADGGGGGGGEQSKDVVYNATTAVVRAVMEMTRGVQQAKAEQYVDLVKVRLLNSAELRLFHTEWETDENKSRHLGQNHR